MFAAFGPHNAFIERVLLLFCILNLAMHAAAFEIAHTALLET